jgi:hypothetical protein
MSVRVKKQKLRGIDKSQKQKLEEVINMLFADSTKHMPLHDLIAKYVTYKNHFKAMLKNLLLLANIVKPFESKMSELLTIYMREYRQYFSIDQNSVQGDEKILEEFYTNYDKFKNSEFLQWVTRIAHKVKKSEMLGKTFREFCIACQNSTITLNIFTNINNEVNPTFDFVRLFHEGIQVSKDDKIVAWKSIEALYTVGKKIYKLTIQPDLPLDYIFNELINGLGKYRSKIRNADKLFDLLHRKSELFRNNFTKYYKQMVQYKSPLELLTSFLGDVVQDKDVQDPTLLLQCKSLIAELRKSFASMPGLKQDKGMDKVNSLIDFINDYIDQFKDMDTKPPAEDISKLTKQFEEQFIPTE